MTEELCYGYAGDTDRADMTRNRPSGGVFGITSNTQLKFSRYRMLRNMSGQFGITSNTLEFFRACRRRIRRLRAGTRSCGPGLPVYDYRGRGVPSHRLGRIHPYIRSCSATGTDR